MSKVNFTVYTLSHCPYCQKAKALLQENGFPYAEVQVDDEDQKTRDALLLRSGIKTFPQIFFGSEVIGSYASLKKIFDENGLQQFRCQTLVKENAS